MKKIFFIVFMLIISSLITYYLVEIEKAKSFTTTKAEKYLSAAKITKNDLTKEQLDILIKLQDPNFYNHKGVDFSTPGNGWTTLTQALAKRFYFKKFKQGLAKIKQTLLARYALHPNVSKDDQITIFINIAYFGKGQNGLVDAADYFFNKKLDQLTRDEYISLLACMIAPTYLNIKQNPQKNKQRVEKIKRYLSGEYKPKGLFDITYDK